MQNIDSSVHRWIAAACLAAVVTSVSGAEPANIGVGDVYPLNNCIVVDLPLDDEAEVITTDGREIRVCCPDCGDQFFQDSYTWITKIDERILQQQLPYYPLTKCIVDDKPLGSEAINYVYRNRLFRLCSGKCQDKLDQEPAKFFGKLDYAVIEKQKRKYPLSTCVVSGKPLGAKSHYHVVANLLVRLSSSNQLENFERRPGKYLEKVREATKKASKARKQPKNK